MPPKLAAELQLLLLAAVAAALGLLVAALVLQVAQGRVWVALQPWRRLSLA